MENPEESTKYLAAKSQVDQLKKFYSSVAVFAIVCGAYLIYQYTEFGEIHFWKSFFIVIWAVILAVKAVKILILNPTWEKNQLERELRNNGH